MHAVRADLDTEAPAASSPTASEPDPGGAPPIDTKPPAPREQPDDRIRRTPPRLLRRVLPVLWFLPLAAAAVAVHGLAAARPVDQVATLGETRLAVGTYVARGLELATDPLPLGDRLAAIQLAVVQLLLPLAGIPIVDAARWACLALGAVTALLAWPVLRGLGVAAPVAAVGMGLLGVLLPAISLHTGISAGAPAAVWLMLAASFAVRQWGRAAVVAAVVAALTAPLAAMALLALGAHLVLGRVVRVPERLRVPVGVLLGGGAAGLAGLAVGAGPLVGAAGPLVGTTETVIGVLAGLLVVGLAWRSADWLRPVLTAVVALLLAALVPGPSRTTAALLVAPMLVVAFGLLLDQLGERMPGRPVTRGIGLVTLLLLILLPTPLVLAERPPPASTDALIAWLITQPRPGTAIQADELDRAELLVAGFPAGQLRTPEESLAPGELRVVADRPTGAGPGANPVRCPGLTTVALVERGAGGAAEAVCRTDGAADTVAAEGVQRTRLGSALADNPSLQLGPAAAAALRAGQVDPRLMLVLTAMTTAHRIAVDDFPAVELDAPTMPRRQVRFTLIDGVSPASSELLRTWLNAQQPPFVPAVIRPDGPALLVGYSAPSPSGLLPE